MTMFMTIHAPNMCMLCCCCPPNFFLSFHPISLSCDLVTICFWHWALSAVICFEFFIYIFQMSMRMFTHTTVSLYVCVCIVHQMYMFQCLSLSINSPSFPLFSCCECVRLTYAFECSMSGFQKNRLNVYFAFSSVAVFVVLSLVMTMIFFMPDVVCIAKEEVN